MISSTGTKGATRALALLLALTACTLAASLLLQDKAGFAVAAAVIAFGKVRLVVLEFLGLRGSRSPLVPALLFWCAIVLLVAEFRTMLIFFQLSVS